MLLFLLDDFLTDLDSRVAFALIKLVASLNVQIFITSPGSSTVIEDAMRQQNILFSEINIG
jgi:recombinational DNA repair ATPase RecF